MNVDAAWSVYDPGKIERVTSKRLRLIYLQNLIRRILRPLGLDVKVDVNYHGSYILGGENWTARFNQDTGKRDADWIAGFVSRDAVVLDIGCSVGRVEQFLASLVAEVHGVDISPLAISRGRKYVGGHPNVHLYVNNGQDLAMFQNDQFDFVFSLFTFLHMSVEDAFCYFIESFRCLKPGGRVLFQFASLNLRYDQFAYRALIGDRTETRPRYYTPEQLRVLFQQVGFEIEWIRDGDFGVEPRELWLLARKPGGEET